MPQVVQIASKPAQLRASLALIGGVAIGLSAGCFSGSASPPFDASFPPNDLGASQDGGASFDMGFAQAKVTLTSPKPLSSAVKLDASFIFAVVMPVLPVMLEPWFRVVPRGSATALGGGFSSKGSSGNYTLTFFPSANLSDDTDYVITVTDPFGSGATLLKTGITAGSHPRLSQCALTTANAGKSSVLDLQFSEPMNQASFAGNLAVTAGAPPTPVTGTLAQISDSEYTFTFNGSGLKAPLTLDIAPGPIAITGQPLDPKVWDSPTDKSGSCEISFPNADFTSPSPVTSDWAPEIK